jgi:hypothetical protein
MVCGIPLHANRCGYDLVRGDTRFRPIFFVFHIFSDMIKDGVLTGGQGSYGNFNLVLVALLAAYALFAGLGAGLVVFSGKIINRGY